MLHVEIPLANLDAFLARQRRCRVDSTNFKPSEIMLDQCLPFIRHQYIGCRPRGARAPPQRRYMSQLQNIGKPNMAKELKNEKHDPRCRRDSRA